MGVDGIGEVATLLALGVLVALTEAEDMEVTRPSQASGAVDDPNRNWRRESPRDLMTSVLDMCVQTSSGRSSESSASTSKSASTVRGDCWRRWFVSSEQRDETKLSCSAELDASTSLW